MTQLNPPIRFPSLWLVLGAAFTLLVAAMACQAPAGPGSAASGPRQAGDKEAAPPAKPDTLRIAFAGVSGTMAVPWYATDNGIWLKHGLDVELVNIPSGPESVQSLLAGERDALFTAVGAVIEADLGGADLVMLAATTPRLTYIMFSQPEIQRLQDLRGKTVGTTRIGTVTDFSARLLLKRAGLDPDRDVTIFQTGGVPNTLAALDSKGIDAGILTYAVAGKARQLGLRELADAAEVEFPSNGPVVTRRLMQERPQVVRRFMEAVVDTIAQVKTNKELAKKSIAKWANLDDEADLEDTYNIYVEKLLPRVPLVPAAGVQNALDELAARNPKARESKPQDFSDNSLLEELQRSGYIDRLYSR